MTKIAIATPPFLRDFEFAFDQKIGVIGTYDFKEKRDYYNWHTLDQANLVIFSGGEDINPEIYGQANKYSHYSEKRDRLEIQIISMCLETNKKMLGVCRGHQFINAYLGGSLAQDLFRDLRIFHEHDHILEGLNRNSLTPNFFNQVNSLHHQGVVKPGKDLIPTSYYRGVIESCENDNIITVQFHPEFMKAEKFFSYLKEWANV